MPGAELFDGHDALSGISGAHPVLVPKNLAGNAVNRRFRGDLNATRLPFNSIELDFPEDLTTGKHANEQRYLFEGGNIQGAYVYVAYPSFLATQIIISIAGTIFRIELSGKKGTVYRLFEGNDPVLQHTWFAQGFEWLVIQNGLQQPILWDGKTAARRADRTIPEVPVGSVMAFIHGRLVVASADGTNQVAVGDIVYGETATNTSDIIRFTENLYWAEGGAFGVPMFIGDINGMAAMPYLDTGTGQNELVILGTEGGCSLDLSKPRLQWQDSQLLRISMIGGGCVSSHSLCQMNGDLMFRSAEGIRSYRNARAEYQQTWHNTPISTDVRKWLRYDQPRLLEYCSQVSWNNLLFCTCSPLLAKPLNNFAGHNRYHRGFVVMDAEPESTTLASGAPIWNGLWTGIRPVQFVEGRFNQSHRCFAFSYDRDGVNRLYEIEKNGTTDMFKGKRTKIFSFYDTSNLGIVERTTNNFQLKRLSGGSIEFSKLTEEVRTTLSVRPDNHECFVEVDAGTVGCDCSQPGPCFQPQQPRSERKVFSGLENICIPGSNQKLKSVRRWQGRVTMEGYAAVERLGFWFQTDDENKTVTCPPSECPPITCCPHAYDYSYHLAPEGQNTNIPVLPTPSDVTPVPEETIYFSTKSVTKTCPEGSTGPSITRTASATSTISQADADDKAIFDATLAAQTDLQCVSCEPFELITVIVNNEDYDLSAFFAIGYLPDHISKPWRLIDLETNTLYALGIVDSTGTLLTSGAVTTGEDTFNSVTNIFTDSSGTSPTISLQIACPGVGDVDQPTWPDPPEPPGY